MFGKGKIENKDKFQRALRELCDNLKGKQT